MAGKLRYAYLDEAPVVFDDSRAFEYQAGHWVSINVIDAQHKARLLSKDEFEKYAGAEALKTLPSF